MKNKFPLFLLLSSLFLSGHSTGALAQEPPNRPVEWFIKAHTANNTSIERDSINNSVIADWVGAVKASPSAIDTLLNAVSTAIDTSKAYRTAPVMTVQHTLTASAGSPDVTLLFYVGGRSEFDTFNSTTPPPFNRFTLADSLNLDAAGSGFWKITASAQPSGSWFYFKLRGESGNGTTAVKLKGMFWDAEKR